MLPRSLDADRLLILTGAYAAIVAVTDPSGPAHALVANLTAAAAQVAHHETFAAFGLVSCGLFTGLLRRRATAGSHAGPRR